jgi:hypothetical protein
VVDRRDRRLHRVLQSLLVVTLAAVGLGLCGRGVVVAQTIDPVALQQIQTILHEKRTRTPAQQKLDSHLHFAGQALRGATNAAMIPSLPKMFDLLNVDEQGNVQVDIQGTVTPALEFEIVALGGTVESSLPNEGAMRAWIPLLAAETLAARSDVTFVKPAAQGTTNTRPIDTKALLSHGVDVVLNKGVTGNGVKVCVLSDGVKSLATLQAAGNLPAVTVLSGQQGPATGDEGTAMLEIVYDLAPGAQLEFATAATGEAQFATNIQNLAGDGCKIIVDDVTYYDEGAFQDGLIARAVNTVTASGVLYFSAAGNSGNLDSGTSGTWEGDFVDSGLGINAEPGKVHAFDATHASDQITTASSNGSWTTLKWSDPLGAACNDYDLFIMDSTLTNVLESSTNVQNCSQDPFEHVTAPAAGNQVVVVLYAGSARALSVATNRGRLAINTSGATFGHNAAASAVTVAATPAQTTLFTNGTPSPETFSSDGPRTIFYNPNGTAITPGNFLFGTNGGTTLAKVDFTAADGGQSAVSGFNPFRGTSAAAPTAAAIAALIWSAHPSLTAADVVNVMKNAALAAHPGFGARTVGSGIVMANLAVTTFVDVLGNHPFFTWIQGLVAAGITGGCATTPALYCPDNSVTRDQMAVFLLRGIHGASYQPPAATGTMFTDVPLSQPLAKWIEELAREGITGGCSTSPPQYCPADVVTRAQMAVFLLRAKHGAGYQPPAATGTMFTDVPLSQPLANWIEELAREGITSGCGATTYCPDDPVTRAEMAVFLVRAFNLPH